MKALWALVLVASVGSSWAAPFNNGSFEQPAGTAPNSIVGFAPGSTNLTGWSIGGVGGSVSYIHGNAVSVLPADGQYHLDFNGASSAPGTWIRQTFDTLAGTNYTISFKVARLGSGSGEVSVTATVSASGGAQLATLKGIASAQAYESKTLTFTATTASTTVEFLDTSLVTAGVDALLDDVQLAIEVVPPPASGFANGSFEQPAGTAPNSIVGFAPGSTNLTGWSIGGVGGSVSYIHGNAVSVLPADGQYHLDFNGGFSSPGTWIRQTFDTLAGTNYTISFKVARLGSGSGEVSVTATVSASGGAQLATLKGIASAQAYESKTLTFTAATTSTTVEFLDTSLVTAGVDALLDDVQLAIEVVPPPPSDFANGSFEQPAGTAPNSIVGFAPGSTNLTGWSIGGVGGSISYIHGNAVSVLPADGQYHLDFNGAGSAPGTWIRQTFNTLPGTNYTISFKVARLGSGSGEVSVTATVSASGGAQLATLKGIASAQAYESKTLTFTAATTSTTVEFLDTSLVTAGVDALLDDVQLSIEVVPPPPSDFANGSFEQPAGITPNSIVGFALGSTNLTGWLIGGSGGSVSYIHGNAVSVLPADGQYHLDFNGASSAPGTWIRQTFKTAIGTNYILKFKVARLGSAPGEVSVTATVIASNGGQLAALKAAPLEQAYETKTIAFTATTEATRLEFLDTSLATSGVDLLLDDVSLNVVEPPYFISQPMSQSVWAQAPASFSVVADGAEPLSYQWRFNGSEIAGATNTTLTLANVSLQDAGSYDVIVSNPFGFATSVAGVLTVNFQFADFDGNGLPDIAWQQIGTGAIALWMMDGTNVLGTSLANGDLDTTNWTVAAQADMNQDGSTDLIAQHQSGAVAIWLMRQAQVVDVVPVREGEPAGSGWQIIGAGDFNGDQSSDLFWQHSDGRLAVWFMNGTQFNAAASLRDGRPPLPGWKVVALPDFDGDGDRDLLWQHSNGRLAAWILEGIQFVSSTQLAKGQTVPKGWRVAGSADFNADGTPDVLLQTKTGAPVVWIMAGFDRVSTVLLDASQAPGEDWTIVGPK